MSDDDELGDRLRRVFVSVADNAPVDPPPSLSPATASHRRMPWVLAAAAAVVVAVMATLVLRDADDAVRTATDEQPTPTSTPATIGADGRIVARSSDGTLQAAATVTVDGPAGRVVVDVRVTDDDGRATVSITGDGLPDAGTTITACDGGSLDADAGFTLGAEQAVQQAPMTIDVSTDGCDGGGGRRVRLALLLPPLSAAVGADGPASPLLTVADDARSGVAADAVDGCLAEVLVDWGDRSTPTSLDVPGTCPTTAAVDALEHDYAPGEYAQRVTVTTIGPDGSGGQGAFVERRLTIE